MPFPLTLALAPKTADVGAQIPSFARLAQLIGAEIRRGRLRPGERLPGTRALAAQLGLGRNTLVAAYGELVAEGYVVTHATGGTFVAEGMPEHPVRRLPKPKPPPEAQYRAQTGFEFEPRVLQRADDPPASDFSLFGGVPDLRQFPSALLARAYRRALRGRAPSALDYTTPFGDVRLRTALAQMVSATRALSATAEQILVTHGSQMAIDLVARALIRPGDRVAVEEIGYKPAWAALKQAGASLVHLPVDEQGLAVGDLETALQSGPIRAVYLTPHHQYPTTVALSVGRRLRLLELAAKHRIAIIEDDYDHEFHYDGRPLASLSGTDGTSVVVYVGTLAKVLAPGLRLGFIAAPQPLIQTLGALRFHVDRHGDTTTERAVAELIEEGELARHIRRMRRTYHARRDAFAGLLHRHLGSALSFTLPAGGMALWAQASPEVDTSAWLARAAASGVHFALGSSYVAPGVSRRRARHFHQHLRLGFARYDETELETAVRRLALALRHVASR